MNEHEFKELLFRLVPNLRKYGSNPTHELAWDAAALLFVQGVTTVGGAQDAAVLKEQIRFMAKNGRLNVTKEAESTLS